MKPLDTELDPIAARPERVLQFGEGNFLRAFIDWMIHRMNQAGKFNGGCVVVQPLEQGLIDVLNNQAGRYTLYLRGISAGKLERRRELITSLSRGLNPYTSWSDYLATAHNPTMRFVVSNTTEAGIVYVPTEEPVDACPASFPAKLTAWLRERFDAFSGSAESGLVFMPCELIEQNGAALKACILHHAGDWGYEPQFHDWIEQDCTFLNTLVDRIVPGYPHEEAEAMCEELGYEDRLICSAEIFHLLVIEGPEKIKAELPFHEAGLNVVWTEDLQKYRTRKVGILNGAHTASVLAAFLGGVNTVREMMVDPDFGPYVRNAVFQEIMPALQMDVQDSAPFARAVLERFQNPFIQHELLSISLNSVAKWKVRVLPSVKNYLADFGQVPPLLAFSLAALLAFYKGTLRTNYEVKDDPAVLSFFAQAWASEEVVDRVLGNEKWWGEDLRKLAGFQAAVSDALAAVLNQGVRAALNQWMSP